MQAFVNEVYHAYLQALEQEPDFKIRALLTMEPFSSTMTQAGYTEEEIETAVYGKLYHEEESNGI